MTIDCRTFLKVAGAQAGLVAAGVHAASGVARAEERGARRTGPAIGAALPDVVVGGAGAFGGWTALNLQQMGMRVTLVDALGPGNSRSTSGDETRGVRSSYGDRTMPQADVWTRWARTAMTTWRAWDAEWSKEMKIQLFYPTGDVIMREDWEPFLKQTKELWEKQKVPFEVLPVDEVRYRWPAIDVKEIEVVLFEPDAGVVRARRACESVAGVFRQLGGEIVQARAWPTVAGGRKMPALQLATGDLLEAGAYVFACGPWLPKVFPELLGPRMRTPMGNVFYFGAATGDQRFTYPNIPSWNFPGVTGWPGLPSDNRGFRVRTGGNSDTDPDTSQRWINAQGMARGRAFVRERFPLLADAPVLETRSCHYALSVGRNFIIDRHPGMDNVWIVGEYAAGRIAGKDAEPELAVQFAMPKATFDDPPPPPPATKTPTVTKRPS